MRGTTIKLIAAAIMLLLAGSVGVFAYNTFKTPEAAGTPITAIPLEASATEAAPAANEPAPAAAAPAATTTTDPVATAAATEAATQPAGTSGVTLARIVPQESEVRFLIDEVLNGQPKTVVGKTNQVAGELSVDPSDPSKTRVGTIQVNARTLQTDSAMRNRTIANRILQTDQYEFISFTPKELVGLPRQGSVGQTYTFKIVGDLTVRDVTKQVTFDVTATPKSATRLEGKATTAIKHADFGITIPQVPQVANVGEQVRIEIDFVAAAA